MVRLNRLMALLAASVGLSMADRVGAEDPVTAQTFISGHVYAPADGGKKVPLAGAVVYLGPTNDDGAEGMPEAFKAKVKDGRLVPDRIVLLVGQKLVIDVQDEDEYLFTFSSPEEPVFGRALPPNLSLTHQEKTFKRSTPFVYVSCGIHPTFREVLTVVPNRSFAKTKEDGSFKLPVNAADGTYEVYACDPTHGRKHSKVEVKRGEEMSIDFALWPKRAKD